MQTHTVIRALVLALGVAALVAGTAHAQAPQASIRITGPANGSMVDGPVTIGVEVNGATVKHWDERDPTAVHHHLLVDVDPATVVQAGVPLPPGQANIIHTIDLNRQLDLPPGPHTVAVVLAGTDHVPFTVRGSSTALSRVGTGGTLGSDAQLPLQAIGGLVALLILGVGGLALRARRHG
jgi:hypothetical protein